MGEAEKEIETAQALDPGWTALRGLLGEVYFYERRFDEALDVARRFRTDEPEFFDTTSQRGSAVARRQWDLARPLLAKGVTRFEQDLARAIGGDVQGALSRPARKTADFTLSLPTT